MIPLLRCSTLLPVPPRDDNSCGAEAKPRNRHAPRSRLLIGRNRADDRRRTVVFLWSRGPRTIKRCHLSHNLLFGSSFHFRSGHFLFRRQALRIPCRIFSTTFLPTSSARKAAWSFVKSVAKISLA